MVYVCIQKLFTPCSLHLQELFNNIHVVTFQIQEKKSNNRIKKSKILFKKEILKK